MATPKTGNPNGRPPKFKTPQQLAKLIDNYFAQMAISDEPITITGLCLYTGFCSRQTFYEYEERPGFTDLIKTARLKVENAYERKLSSGQVIGAIFALKNMKWTDKTEIEMKGDMAINWAEDRSYNEEPEKIEQTNVIPLKEINN